MRTGLTRRIRQRRACYEVRPRRAHPVNCAGYAGRSVQQPVRPWHALILAADGPDITNRRRRRTAHAARISGLVACHEVRPRSAITTGSARRAPTFDQITSRLAHELASARPHECTGWLRACSAEGIAAIHCALRGIEPGEAERHRTGRAHPFFRKIIVASVADPVAASRPVECKKVAHRRIALPARRIVRGRALRSEIPRLAMQHGARRTDTRILVIIPSCACVIAAGYPIKPTVRWAILTRKTRSVMHRTHSTATGIKTRHARQHTAQQANPLLHVQRASLRRVYTGGSRQTESGAMAYCKAMPIRTSKSDNTQSNNHGIIACLIQS